MVATTALVAIVIAVKPVHVNNCLGYGSWEHQRLGQDSSTELVEAATARVGRVLMQTLTPAKIDPHGSIKMKLLRQLVGL